MLVLPQPLQFQWDKGNIDKNAKKHDVLPKEAEEIFVDEYFIILSDDQHSLDEERAHGFGQTFYGRYLFVTFTNRFDAVRVISARDMNKKEVKFYEETKKNTKI